MVPSFIKVLSPPSFLISQDSIYICGGNDGNNILNSFEAYNIQKEKWQTLESLNWKRDELAIAMGPDYKIYAIGGFGGPKNSCLQAAERYDIATNKWEQIADLNIPRRALSAVALPDGIYAIGGFDGQNYLSSIEKYDEVKNEWTFISSMNYARCTLSAIATPDC